MSMRRSSPRASHAAPRVAAALAGVVLGIALVAALRAGVASRQEQSPQSQEMIAREAELTQANAQLTERVKAAEKRLLGLEDAAARESEDMAMTRLALDRARTLSGQTDMEGPGVRVVLDDAPRESIQPGDDIRWYIVHDVDVLRVVNQLRAAGAECISINGERLVSNSRIRCGGPTIHVKDRALAPPFEILAIGDPKALYDGLAAPAEDGGMSELEVLGFFGVRAEVTMADWLRVPRYLGEFRFQYAYAEEREG